jgi:hypothetical protein
MHTLANVVGHPANGENVASAVKRESVGGIETVAGHHLGMNGLQPRIVSLE